MGKYIDATLRLIDDFSKPMQNAMTRMEASAKTFKRAGKDIQRTGKQIASAGKTLTAAVTLPIAGLATAAIKTAADFEAAMSNVQAIAGASADDMQKLSEKAKEMGAITKFSATDSAAAFTYMAQAGWGTQAMLDGIEGIMYLAGATGEDLAATSDIVTDALTAFGMQANETQRFVDVLAQTANASNTNVSLMGETFQYVAPAAGALGYSIEDTSVAIGLMANSGIKASQAGTSLKNLLVNLAKPTSAMEGSMERLGISMTDSAGQMKPLSQLMQEMRNSFSTLTPAQKAAEAATLAGKEGMAGFLAIVNASQGDFDKLTASINDSSGAAKEMYNVANDNLMGRLTELQGTMESIAITVGTKLMPYVEKGVAKLKEMADAFGALSDEQLDTIIRFAGIVAVVGPGLMIFGKMVSIVGTGVTMFGKLGTTITKLKKSGTAASIILKGIKLPGLPNMTKIPLLEKLIGSLAKVAGGAGGKVAGSFAKMGSGIGSFAKVGLTPMAAFGGKFGKIFGGLGKVAKAGLSPLTKFFGIFGTLGKALFTFLGPGASVILIIGAIVAAGILLYKNWDKVVEIAKKLGTWVKKVFDDCGFSFDFFKGKADESGGKFGELAQKAMELWTVIQPVVAKITEVLGLGLGVYLSAVIGGAIGLFGSLMSSVMDIASGIMRIFGGIIDFLTGVFTGNWSLAWQGIKDIFGGVFDSLVALAKTPINAIISIINGMISGINNMGFDVPDWVPGIGGSKFQIGIPTIPMLYTGTDNWGGGSAMIHDKGAEIVDLPSGSRVYPHDESLKMAKAEGSKSFHVSLAKFADQIVIKETADAEEVMNIFGQRLEEIAANMA